MAPNPMPPEVRANWSRWRGIGPWWFGSCCAGWLMISRVLGNLAVPALGGELPPLTYGAMTKSALLGFALGLALWRYQERRFALPDSEDSPRRVAEPKA